MKRALLSEIGIGVSFQTLITERKGLKIGDYSFKHNGTWVKLYPSTRKGYSFPHETKSVHDMLVKVLD